MIAQDAEETGEWISSLMYSGWFYAVIAAMAVFFFVTLILGLIWLFGHKKEKHPKTIPHAAQDTTFDYSALLAAAGTPNGKPRRLLLAAASLDNLPVTIPVNLAIQLAATEKCLLIDLDTRRDALSHVFEIASVPRPATPVVTGVANLHIWPAHLFTQFRQMDLKSLLAATQPRYDIILLNAPYLAAHPDRGRIIRCAESAVVFSKDKKSAAPLRKLLDKSPCKILKMLGPDGRPLA